MFCKVKHCRYPHTHTTREHQCGKCGQKGHGQVECNSTFLKQQLEQFHNDILPINKQCKSQNCQKKEYHTSESHICEICNERHIVEECPSKIIKLDCPICRTPNCIPNSQPRLFALSDDNKCRVCLENTINIFLPQCGHVCICSECVVKLDTSLIPNNDDLIIAYNRQTGLIDSSLFGIFENILKEAIDVLNSDNRKVYIVKNAGMGCQWYFRQLNSSNLIEGFFMHNDNWGQYGPQLDYRDKLQRFKNGYLEINC